MFQSEARSQAHALCHRLQQTSTSLLKGCKTHESVQKLPPFLVTLTSIDDANASMEHAERTVRDIPTLIATSKAKLKKVDETEHHLHSVKNQLFLALQASLNGAQ